MSRLIKTDPKLDWKKNVNEHNLHLGNNVVLKVS